MDTAAQRIFFGLSFVLVVTISAVYLFLAVAIVPYWQDMSGLEIQNWFAGPFVRFSYMMGPVHLLSMFFLGTTFVVSRKSSKSSLLLLALVTLLICQAFNFTLYGAVLNPALQSQELSPDEALATLDRWDFFHNIRTLSVVISAIILTLIVGGDRQADSANSNSS